jgi:uncharacterized protein YgbK (DUF1537 family)
MAANNPGTADVRRQIEAEREKLADAVDELREAADVTAIMRSKLPVLAAAAAGAGFFLAGGVGATMRLLARRGREGKTKAKAGRFRLVQRN